MGKLTCGLEMSNVTGMQDVENTVTMGDPPARGPVLTQGGDQIPKGEDLSRIRTIHGGPVRRPG